MTAMPRQHGGMDADMMTAMPAEAMEGMDASMMTMMPPEAMGGMSADMMTACPAEAMGGMSADMMAAALQRLWGHDSRYDDCNAPGSDGWHGC